MTAAPTTRHRLSTSKLPEELDFVDACEGQLLAARPWAFRHYIRPVLLALCLAVATVAGLGAIRSGLTATYSSIGAAVLVAR
jgi:hypothetical protein